jgi:aspartate aminotransferase/aromatic-amino-acid transaminase
MVINDPCQNPTGYSLTEEEWIQLISYLNEVSETAPVVLINDIAYIDYSYQPEKSRNFLSAYNGFSDKVMACIAFSCSKTMTSYGLRCGAAILLTQQEKDLLEVETVMEKTARATWSNIPNAAMENFVWVVTEGKEPYLEEKQYYVDLLKQRSDIFLTEAKACGLPIYPYREGFFITVKVDNNDRVERIHEELMNRHIYTVTVKKGIRFAICSLPVKKIYGLAEKVKAVLDEVK